LFSKESAMTFQVVIPLSLWLISKAKLKKILFDFAGLAVVAEFYLLTRSQFVDSTSEYRFITLSVFANIITPTSADFAERFLFIPSIVFSVAVSWILLKLFKVPDIPLFSLKKMPAANCFRNSIGLDPCNPDAWLNIASCHYNQWQYDSAIIYYQKTLQLNPGESNAWNSLGMIAWSRKQTADAVGFFRKAAENNPGMAENYREMGINLK
jgi:tetratricopeptide (TPR) repeat protein